MKLDNLITIGTSHIAKQSLKEVKAAVEKEQPDIIAIELDRKRYYGITHDTKKRRLKLKDIKKIGLKGFLFNMMGAWIEKKLGKMVGVEPGAEMMLAIKLAKENNIKIALIDQDIEITLAKISKELTWKERFNFIIDIFKGIFFRKSEMEKIGIRQIDLSKVPSKTIIRKLTKNMEKRYPGLYKVLIKERNSVMASNLKRIMQKDPEKKIVAVIGAGHEEDIINLIKGPDISYYYGYSYNF